MDGMNKKERNGRQDNAVDGDSPSPLWLKSSLTQTHPRPMYVESKEGGGSFSLSLSPSPSPKSLIQNPTHYSADPSLPTARKVRSHFPSCQP